MHGRTLKRIIDRFRSETIVDPELGTLVRRGLVWDGAIAFPNREGSADVVIQAGDPAVPPDDCFRKLILGVRSRADFLQSRIVSNFSPPKPGTWEIVVIDVQGTTCDAPDLELTLERAEDSKTCTVIVRGPLDSPQLTILNDEVDADTHL